MSDDLLGGQAPQPTDSQPITPEQPGTLLNNQYASNEPQKFNDWRDNVPAKFIKDGNVNNDALVQSYLHLEKRMGSGDAPPQDANGYKLTLPDGTKDEDFAEFKADALKMGLNNTQAQGVLDAIMSSVKEMREGLEMTSAKAEAALRETWQNEQDFNKNLSLAQKAAKAYDVNTDVLGNNPEVIKLLAKIGGELGEDRPVNQSAIMQSEDLRTLMTSEAYLNPHHVNHKSVMARVQSHYNNAFRQ